MSSAALAAPRAGLVARLAGHRLFAIGFATCMAMLAVAAAADLIATHDPGELRAMARNRPPSAAHWFGTDGFGRDIYSRVVHGARISLAVGTLVALTTGVLGTLLGLASGYFRALDEPLMRLMDAFMALPSVLLALAITAALGPSLANVIVALAITYTPRTARVVRASVLVTREQPFIEAARAYGARDARIVLRHVLPNSLAPLIVQLTFIFAYAVLAEAVLSFLGMGPPPPTPSWGAIVAEGRNALRIAPWICIFPGIAIALFVLGLNLLGDGLRDVLDPRLDVERD